MSAWNPPPELGSITPLPHGFLVDLAAAQDTDALQSILAPLGKLCLFMGSYAVHPHQGMDVIAAGTGRT